MKREVIIALDAMGGDHGPGVVVPAAAIALERRPDTRYLLFGDEGVAARLRRMRIEQAQVMLLHEPGRPVASVGFACGFESESGFHRAFRTATGMTPGEYRRAWHSR